ncbi:MAG: ACT domain-containing protein [Clostridiales bacterium]|nr:ACT domain-containing protein [Clostridiales bacterium]
MRAVVTVIGLDREGIIARVSDALYKKNINILDIAQNVLRDVFAMVMLIDLSKSSASLSEVRQDLDLVGQEIGMKILVMHEGIFDAMHKI